MTTGRLQQALSALSMTAEELGEFCDRGASEYGPMWHSVSRNARALIHSGSSEIAEWLRTVSSMFSYHTGSFSEIYVKRTNIDEQIRENEAFEATKDRVAAAMSAVRDALWPPASEP
jgi:hypothetical protein